MAQRRNELAEKAVAILATTFVMFGGLAASVFLIVSNSSAPTSTLLYFAGGCLAGGLLLWLLRDPDPLSPRGRVFAWFRKPKRVTHRYQFAVRKPTRTMEAPPQPPTVERIREISQESAGTWVPSQVPNRKRPQK